MPAISVSVKPEVYFNLEKAAKWTGLTKSKITEKALTNYLDELKEDMEDAAAGEKAWEEFVKSGKKGIPASELYKELGL